MHAAIGNGESWKKKAKNFVALHLQQVPCLHAVVPAMQCWRRGRYQSLEQEEDANGAALHDQSQKVNKSFGRLMIKLAIFIMIGLTIMLSFRNSSWNGK